MSKKSCPIFIVYPLYENGLVVHRVSYIMFIIFLNHQYFKVIQIVKNVKKYAARSTQIIHVFSYMLDLYHQLETL